MCDLKLGLHLASPCSQTSWNFTSICPKGGYPWVMQNDSDRAQFSNSIRGPRVATPGQQAASDQGPFGAGWAHVGLKFLSAN